MSRFSRTVSSTSSVSSCGTTPSRARISRPSLTGSRPRMDSSPALGGDTQPIIRMVEDLPAPFGPRKPNASPRCRSKSIPSTAVKLPNRLTRPRARISGETADTYVRLPGRPDILPPGFPARHDHPAKALVITPPSSRPPARTTPRRGYCLKGRDHNSGGGTRKDGRLVTVVRELYVRFQRLIHEAAKFGVVGIVGVFITNGGYALLHNTVGLGPVTSTTIATIVATAVSYVANRYWSFRHRERTSVAREGVIFFILNGIGLLIQDAVVAFNFYLLGNGQNKAAEFIALNAGIALATLFRFWSYRKWVWAAPADGAPAATSGHQPTPTPSPPWAAHSAAQQHAAGQNGDGHAPGLLHANGQGANGQRGANGHGGSGQGTHTGPGSRNGRDR